MSARRRRRSLLGRQERPRCKEFASAISLYASACFSNLIDAVGLVCHELMTILMHHFLGGAEVETGSGWWSASLRVWLRSMLVISLLESACVAGYVRRCARIDGAGLQDR